MGTSVFKASSGREVKPGEDGSLLFGKANGYLSPGSAMDAAEYFQALQDEELGRWRDKLDPDYVVYYDPETDRVTVTNERNGAAAFYSRTVVDTGLVSTQARVATRFFEAHPDVKPWHDAKPGEFWQVHHMGMVEVCRVDGFRFVGVDMTTGDHVSMPVDHPSITEAHRMVAEVAS